MTQLDVLYRYGVPPTEAFMIGISRIREVYGVRRLELNERDRTVRVEYDATRLTEPVIHKLLRSAGLDLIENIPLAAPPPPKEAPAEPPVPTA